MPLYEYECDACSRRFEIIQRFSDGPPDACRVCGKGPVRRLASSPAIQFKGSGFYITDYAQKGKSGSEGGSSNAPKTETKDSKKRFRMIGEPRRGSSGDMSLAHMKDFLDCVQSRNRPASDVEIGHNSMIACHLANIAFRTGRRVKWDAEREQVVGDADAQKLITKAYRAPWSLPQIPTASV